MRLHFQSEIFRPIKHVRDLFIFLVLYFGIRSFLHFGFQLVASLSGWTGETLDLVWADNEILIQAVCLMLSALYSRQFRNPAAKRSILPIAVDFLDLPAFHRLIRWERFFHLFSSAFFKAFLSVSAVSLVCVFLGILKFDNLPNHYVDLFSSAPSILGQTLVFSFWVFSIEFSQKFLSELLIESGEGSDEILGPLMLASFEAHLIFSVFDVSSGSASRFLLMLVVFCFALSRYLEFDFAERRKIDRWKYNLERNARFIGFTVSLFFIFGFPAGDKGYATVFHSFEGPLLEDSGVSLYFQPLFLGIFTLSYVWMFNSPLHRFVKTLWVLRQRKRVSLSRSQIPAELDPVSLALPLPMPRSAALPTLSDSELTQAPQGS